MILKDGIISLHRRRDISSPGDMPRYADETYECGYYAELHFETRPVHPTDARTERRIDARVRMLLVRGIREDDEATLDSFREAEASGRRYRIVRVYHGEDAESGALISDLSLEEVSP